MISQTFDWVASVLFWIALLLVLTGLFKSNRGTAKLCSNGKVHFAPRWWLRMGIHSGAIRIYRLSLFPGRLEGASAICNWRSDVDRCNCSSLVASRNPRSDG